MFQILLITLCLVCASAHAFEEWLIDRFDTAFLSIGYRHYSTKQFWNKQGNKKPSFNRFDLNEYRFYGQYGLTPIDTIGLYGAYDRIQESLNGRSMGWVDFEIDWKHLLWRTCDQQLAMQFIVIIPSNSEFKPALRYGRFGGEGALSYRHLFYIRNRRGWLDLRGGYRTYQGFPSDQLRAQARIGYTVYMNGYLKFDLEASSDLEYGVFNGQRHFNQSLIAFASNYRLLKVQVETVIYVCERYAFSLGYDWHAWGVNVGTGGEFFANGSIKF